jgi:hypothetical protein
MPKSAYLRNEIRKHIFRTGSFTKPSALYISLHTGDPGAAGANEVSGGSYARVQRDPLDANWTAPANGQTDNAAAITFPTPMGHRDALRHLGCRVGRQLPLRCSAEREQEHQQR